MADFDFEGNTFRNVVNYLNSTGMQARYGEGEIAYTSESGGKIVIYGHEGKEGIVQTSGNIEGEILLNLSRITGDRSFLDKRAEAIKEIAGTMPAARKAAMGILESQARATRNFDMDRPITGGKN